MAISLTAASSHYLQVADNDLLSFGDASTDSPFSVMALVNMDDATTFRICSKYDGSSQEWSMSTDGSDFLRLSCFDNAVNTDTRIDRISDATVTSYEGQWVWLAATYDGGSSASGITLYVAGASVASSAVDGVSYVAMHNQTTDLYVGLLNTDYSDGDVADVRIYSRKLSAAEIAHIAAMRGADRVVNGLVMRLPMIGTSGATASGASTVKDWSGNGLHATPTNSPTYVSAPQRLSA